MKKDSEDMVKKCQRRQEFSNVPHYPPQELTLIASPLPFAQSRVDMVGPLPPGKGKAKFVVVAINYFTKWMEAKPLATIIEKEIENFL